MVFIIKYGQKGGVQFLEYREIQNYYNKQLRKALDASLSSSDPEALVIGIFQQLQKYQMSTDPCLQGSKLIFSWKQFLTLLLC